MDALLFLSNTLVLQVVIIGILAVIIGILAVIIGILAVIIGILAVIIGILVIVRARVCVCVCVCVVAYPTMTLRYDQSTALLVSCSEVLYRLMRDLSRFVMLH